MEGLSLRRLPMVMALALLLLITSFLSDRHLACAHDLTGLCLDPEVQVGPGDTLDKGNYPFNGPTQADRRGGPSPAGSENVRLLGHADPGTGFNADVVAHRGFAYMGSWGNLASRNCPSFGVRVFDLQNPADPTHVATFADAAGDPAVAGSWTEKVIVKQVATPAFTGALAAVSFQACQPDGFRGFGVYDVTDPANPQKLALVPREAGASAWGSHEIWLEARDGRAYVYTAIILSELLTSPDGETPGEPDFQIWDVTDPRAPAKVGEWGAWAELGVRPIRQDELGTTRVNFVHSVIGDRDRAYLSYWDLGTVILDVSDPANPTFIGRTEFADNEEGNAHSAWLARGGRVLIQTDEDFSPNPGAVIEQAWGYPRFFDISDPASPDQIAIFELESTRMVPPPGPGFFTVHDPKVRGIRAYFSWYAEGVVVLDISDPASPTKIAQFVPEPTEDPRGFFFPGEEFPNVWGVFIERDYVLASDINSGLWVFKLDRAQ